MKKIKVTANNIKEAAYGAYMDYIKYTEKWKKNASMSNFFVGYVSVLLGLINRLETTETFQFRGRYTAVTSNRLGSLFLRVH
jgi:hypothetical protein